MNNENNSGNKLVEEWNADEDDQIIWLGVLLAAFLLFGTFAYNALTGDDVELDVAAEVESDEDTETDEAEQDAEVASPTSVAVEEEEASFLGLAPVLSPLAGDVNGTRNENAVTLTGYVANDDEKGEAEEAALSLDDVDSVNNQLQILEPSVTEALNASGVVNANASGVGTVLTVTGSVANEAARDAAITDAEAVTGVTQVIDQLTISAVDVANTLPQVEFATGSSQILETSFDNLREAATLLSGADAAVEVQGYTDTVGDAAANQALSQARADAVRSFLIQEGVDATTLTAVGYGETTQFAEGDTDEAYAENRKVLFSTEN